MEVVVVDEDFPRSVITQKNGSKNGVLNNRNRVSSTKKPARFYANLAKIMNQHNEVVLSALGRAIGTVVNISTGWATEKKISTSTIESKAENKGLLIH
ncbi:uncharacterized protein At2g34160-like [Wolffia australiana]